MSKYVVKAEIEYLVDAGTPDGAYRKFTERMVTDFKIDCDMNAPTITLRAYRGLEVKYLEPEQVSVPKSELEPAFKEEALRKMGLVKPSLAEEYSAPIYEGFKKEALHDCISQHEPFPHESPWHCGTCCADWEFINGMWSKT